MLHLRYRGKKYSNLTEANKHVCLSLLPKKQKAEKKLFNDHDLVTNARKNFETAKLKHETRATRRSAKVLADAQKVLDDAYLTAESLFIQGTSWKIINEICGHKDHPSIQLKGGSAEKRREHWFDHFQGLLGNSPKVNKNFRQSRYFYQSIHC